MTKEKTMTSFNLAITTVFTALACIATMVFSIYVPATQGFFNIGEAVIFLAAILFGPTVGGIAGGLGSALADLFLGFWYYAPATFIVKACEGVVVGTLKRMSPISSRLHWRAFTVALGILIGVLLGSIGTAYYSGNVELTLGSSFFEIYIPAEFWLLLGAITTLSISLLGLLADPEIGWTIFSVISGGLVMVLGYFVYQMFFIFPLFNIEVVAVVEIPINIGQMIIGAIIALPIIKVVIRALPHLKEKYH